MNSTPELPPRLAKVLSRLATYNKLLRLARGTALFIATAGGLLLLLFWSDAILAASASWRGLVDVEGGWSAEQLRWLATATALVLLAAAVCWIVTPLCNRSSRRGLAALIERQYPELGERLLTAVELTDKRSPFTPPRFVEHLLSEADRHLPHVRLTRVLSPRPAQRAAVAAGVVLVVAATTVAIQPAGVRDFGSRLTACWAAGPPLHLATSGEVCVVAGQTAVLTATIERRDSRVAFPASVVGLVESQGGSLSRMPMEFVSDGGRSRRFRLEIADVSQSLRYRIVAPPLESDSFQVRVLEPVRLAGDSPKIVVVPPEYVKRDVFPEMELSATAADVSSLEYGTVRYAFRFTARAKKAELVLHRVEKNAVRGKGLTRELRLPIALDEGGSSGRLSLPYVPAGRYRLEVATESPEGIRWRGPISGLLVWPDNPPRFAAPPLIQGVNETALPDSPVKIALRDSLPLSVQGYDNVGLGALTLLIARQKSEVERIVLANGQGDNVLVLEKSVPLPELQHGERIRIKLVLEDNRRVPKHASQDADGHRVPVQPLPPQRVIYPSDDKWIELVADKEAKPLEERVVIRQEAEIDKQLAEIKEKLIQAREKLAELATPTRFQKRLDPQQLARLEELQQRSEELNDRVKKLADAASKIPELREVGNRAEQLRQQEMHRADLSLRSAEKHQGERGSRNESLDRAELEWAQALKKLEELRKQVAEKSQDRLAAVKLKQLAERERQLAKRAEEIARSKKADALKQLQGEQEQLQAELEKAAAQSKLLEQSEQMALQAQAGKLAQQAEQLAEQQEKLSQAADEVWNQRLARLLAELARQQGDLAARAEKLGRSTAGEAKKIRVAPLDAAPAKAAAPRIKDGSLDVAVALQLRAAQEMERLAGALGGVSQLARSPRAFVMNLAEEQKKIERRFLFEGVMASSGSAGNLLAVVRKFQAETERIRQSVRRALASIPSQDRTAAVERAAASADDALRELLKPLDSNIYKTQQRMRRAWESLQELAATLPAAPPARQIAEEMKKKNDAMRAEAQKLAKLALEQRELRQKILSLFSSGNAGKGGDRKALDQLRLEQAKLRKKADSLHQALENLKKQSKAKMQQAAEQAAQAARSAREAMKQAEQKARENDALAAKRATQRAAEQLRKAAEMAGKIGNGRNTQGSKAKQELGRSMQQARQQAAQGQQQLKQGRPSQAKSAMQKAASALAQAAQQMAQQMRQPPKAGGQPAQRASPLPPFRLSDLNKGGETRKKYSGLRWGELPGELRTRIIMDMRGQYGAEYAEVIRRYFESIAEPQGKPE